MKDTMSAARLAEGDCCLQEAMSETSLRSLHELREQGLLCDAVLRLEDGSTLPVHRALLSASSAYFRAVFTTTLHREERREVELVGVEPEIVRTLVEYVYLRKVNVTPANVTRLLAAADYLALLGVRRLCTDYLKGLITPDTCVSILLYARDHFCPDLEKEARNFVLRYFVEVSQKSADLLELGVDEVRELIGSDELNVKNEEAVWEFLVRWVDREPETRKAYLPHLIGLIRLGLMNEAYFLEKVKEHKYISGNEACRPIIIDTLRFLYDLEMIGQSQSEVSTPAIARPRIPHEVLFAIGGWSGGSPTSCIETYDTRADRWVKVAEVDASGPRAYHGTAVIGHEIYVIGGFDGIEYFNSCRCFNAVNKTWREVAPMNCKRCYVSVAVLNDVIYAMGGYDGHHRQNTAEKYDFKTNQWTMIAPMNAQRSDASATTLNGKIYITGGFNGQECLNSAEVYDPEINSWLTIPPMRSRRSGVSCIGYQGCLYVIGGFNGISRMCSGEKFNPATITWSSIPDMYNPRSNFAIEVIDDMIFTIGGFNGVTTIYHVECYDGKTNDWVEAGTMNLNRSALACAVVRELPETSSYTDRDSLMFEDLGRRVHSSGDHLDGLPHRQANTLNINQDQLQEFQAYFQQGSLPTIEELPEPPDETQGEMLQALEIIVEIVDPNQTGISEILPPENNNFEGPEEKEEEPEDDNKENFVTNKDGDNKYVKEAMTMTWETEVDLETRSSIVHFDDSSLFVEKSEYYSINFEDEPNDLNTSDASTMCNALDLGVHSTMSKDEEFEEPLDEELSDDTLEDDLFRDPLEAEEHCGDSLEEQYWDVYYDEFQVV